MRMTRGFGLAMLSLLFVGGVGIADGAGCRLDAGAGALRVLPQHMLRDTPVALWLLLVEHLSGPARNQSRRIDGRVRWPFEMQS